MRVGNIASLIRDRMSVVYDSGVLSSSVSEINIPNLNGNVAEHYQIIMYIVKTGSSKVSIRFNNDNSSNYGILSMRGNGTTASSDKAVSQTEITYANSDTTGVDFLYIDMPAVISSRERTMIIQGQIGCDTNGVGEVFTASAVYNKDEAIIESLQVISSISNGIGVGSRVIVLSKQNEVEMRSGVIEVEGDAELQWDKVGQENLKAYISIADSDDWNMIADTTSNKTIRFKVNMNAVETTGLISQSEGLDDFFRIFYVKDTGFRVYAQSGGSLILDTGINYIAQPNVWYDVVVVKVGNKIGIYIDGQQIGYGTFSTTRNYSAPLMIGQDGNGYSFLNGYMDEILVEDGNIYNANPQSDNSDTISLPTGEIVGTGNTLLLLHCEDFTDEAGRHTLVSNYVTIDEIGGYYGKGFVFSGDESNNVSINEVTFTDKVNGDESILYYIVGQGIPVNDKNSIRTRLNGDDTAGNYVYQLIGSNSSSGVYANSGTESGMITFYNATNLGYIWMFEMLIYVNSGNVRVGLTTNIVQAGTSDILEMNVIGNVWVNDADNVSSIVVNAGDGDYGEGTRISLYRLKGDK